MTLIIVSWTAKLTYNLVFLVLFFVIVQEIELVFKPHPKDHDPETVAQQTRYIKTTANASGEQLIIRNLH